MATGLLPHTGHNERSVIQYLAPYSYETFAKAPLVVSFFLFKLNIHNMHYKGFKPWH